MITIKGKVHRRLSEETVAFDAVVLVEGRVALDITSRGTGGCARVLGLGEPADVAAAKAWILAEARRIWEASEPDPFPDFLADSVSEAALIAVPELLRAARRRR